MCYMYAILDNSKFLKRCIENVFAFIVNQTRTVRKKSLGAQYCHNIHVHVDFVSTSECMYVSLKM